VDGTPDNLAQSGGRYRDVFEKRHGEWKILRRLVIYDWATAHPYAPGWDFLQIPVGINRGAMAPDDATYDSVW
jgi:hypothetical protein